MKKILLVILMAGCFVLYSAVSLKVVWGMVDHNGDEFTQEKLDKVSFKAQILNFGNGYASVEVTEKTQGNSVQFYNGTRGVCIIDFSNFSDWEWRAGDELKLVIKDHSEDTKEYWHEAIAGWYIPENPSELYEFGFEDLGLENSGDPISNWNPFYIPEKHIYLGITDSNGNIFDFSAEPYDNVTFSCFIAGRENDILDHNSATAGYVNYGSTASAIYFDLYEFESEWAVGDTLHMSIKQKCSEPGFNTGVLEYVIESTLDEYILIGLDDWYGDGQGGGPPLKIDSWSLGVQKKVYYHVLDYNGNNFDFSAEPYDNVMFKAWMLGRENEILREYSDGSQLVMLGGAYSAVCINVAYFPTEWQEDDVVRFWVVQSDGSSLILWEGVGDTGALINDGVSQYNGFVNMGVGTNTYPIYLESYGSYPWDNWVSISEDYNLPEINELYQNYPNPFNPETQIRFALSKSADVKLSVYNISGQLVSQLASGNKQTGVHTIDFDGSRLNSGIYYYTLEVDGNAMTKKMVLIK